MKILIPCFLIVACELTGTGKIWGQIYHSGFDLRVPSQPEIVLTFGQAAVCYELQITNFSSDTLIVKALSVEDGNHSVTYAAFHGEALTSRFARVGSKEKNQEALLAPGSMGIIYIESDLPRNNTATALTHEIEFKRLEKGTRVSGQCRGGVTQLIKQAPLVLGAPLKGGLWATVYHPSWQTGHRRVIYTIDGKARIPGRFAIDFIKVDELGRYANGDEDEIKNWFGYGSEVLAVANGVVASTSDSFSESAKISAHPPHTADKATGNYISIDLGNGRFAFYEHLKPGSILVQPGQKIVKGQVIASLGFTGQSTGPHLHFHVADFNAPLGAEGVPFVFEHFNMLGRYETMEKFGKALWTAMSPLQMLNERPAPNAVIKF